MAGTTPCHLDGSNVRWSWCLARALASDYISDMTDTPLAHPGIAAREEESFCIIPGRCDAGLILLCDHAGNEFPPGYATLGLPPEQLTRHIAYDIGAAQVTRGLAAALGAPALMTRYSRLLIDPNRGLDDPTLIMRISDGAVIPGNRLLVAAEREKRIRLYYQPYHEAVDAVIDQCLASRVGPMLLSIHSFTESWNTTPRPWHVGVLWGADGRFASPLLDSLHAEGDLIVGDNEPYHGHLVGDCMWQHGTQRGVAHALIEIRQDLIRDRLGQTAWSRRLFRVVERIVTTQMRPTGRGAACATGTGSSGNGEMNMMPIDKSLERELEAAAFRRLTEHLRARSDVQNIDLMNLAGFCRNCLANWYQDAAKARGLELSKDGAREIVYGMPYKEWQAKHQTEASAQQMAAFATAKPHDQ